jgi:hypothetical protein
MEQPKNVKLFEGELATFWFDETGILYANSNSITRTLEIQKRNYDFIREITGNKKVCIITDTTSSSPLDKEMRNYVEKEITTVFKAMAIVSHSPLGKMIANSFLMLQTPSIPIKFFTDETEAKNWLINYL